MTKVQLIENVAARLKLNANLVGDVVDSLLSEATEALQRGEEIKLVGYGTLKVKTLKPRAYAFGGKPEVRTVVRLYVGRKSKWKSTLSSKSNQSPAKK